MRPPYFSYDPGPHGTAPPDGLPHPPAGDLPWRTLPATGALARIARTPESVRAVIGKGEINPSPAFAISGNGDGPAERMLCRDGKELARIRAASAEAWAGRWLHERIRVLARTHAALFRLPGDAVTSFVRPYCDAVAELLLGLEGGQWQDRFAADAAICAAVPRRTMAQAGEARAAWARLEYRTGDLLDAKLRRPDGSITSALITAIAGESPADLLGILGTLITGVPTPAAPLAALVAERADGSMVPLGALVQAHHYTWASPRLITDHLDLGDGRTIYGGTVVIPSLTAARIPFGLRGHACPSADLAAVVFAAALDALSAFHPNMRLACPYGDLEWETSAGVCGTPGRVPVQHAARRQPGSQARERNHR